MAKKSSSRSKKSKKSKGKGSKKGKKKSSRKKDRSEGSSKGKQEPKVAPDPEQAERMALLQLRIGRASHQYSMAAAIALAVSGILLLLMEPGRPLEGLPRDAKLMLPWLAPIMAGAFIATGAFALKWRAYAGARLSPHFLLTLVAFIVSVGTLLRLILQSLDDLEPQAVAWVYPSALAGISLTLISLAITWRGIGRRKLTSILSAAFPTAVMVYAFTPVFSTGIPTDLLILTFMGSAVAVQFSGSMLHIIASSTSAGSKELIRVSNDRLQILADEVKSQKQALDYKEEALRTRETDLEVNEKAIAKRLKALEDERSQIEELEAKVEKELKELRSLQKKLDSQEADLATREESLQRRDKELTKKEKGLDKAAKAQSKRESELERREKNLEKRDGQLAERQEELDGREEEVADAERSVEKEQKELEKRRKELLGKESELEIRERAVEEGAELMAAGPDVPEKLKKLETRLLQREKDLSKREVELKTKTEELEGELKKAKNRNKRAKRKQEKASSRKKELSKLEKKLDKRDSELKEREKELERQQAQLEKALSEAEEKESRYEELSKKAHAKSSKVSKAEKEIQEAQEALSEREAKLEALQKELKKEREKVDEVHQQALRKEKELEARESELKLRQMEADKQLQNALKGRGATDLHQEKQKALELWEKRLKEKEQEMKSKLYEKAKALKEKAEALQERENQLREGVLPDEEEEPEEIPEAIIVEDRVPSGTPRLDDLLMGGLPLGSQVLFLGPAFVGKEIGIHNFIAEGLKQGVPCVIVTTSRPPEEVAKEMGPILPSFLEYEQLGLVRWVDGSSPEATGKKNTPVVEDNRYVVAGAGDYEGILAALERIQEDLEGEDAPYLRLAFLTLSTSLTQGGEKEAANFVQKLVNRMRQTESVALYALDSGMHNEQQLKAVEHQMDGAIHFKEERQKNLLQVAGICEVQTRGWVEYKYNNRALLIGAFMLERIR